jgi:hypothetical protein
MAALASSNGAAKPVPEKGMERRKAIRITAAAVLRICHLIGED